MRYQLKEKVWSLGSNYVICDEGGEPAYSVKGKLFSWGTKLSFQNMEGKELLSISQKLLSLKPCYEIFRDGEAFAQVVQEFSWLKKKFTLDVPGPNDYTVAGSFWLYEYTFERGRQAVATVSKSMWSMTDTYGVDIIEDEDDEAILATVVILDLACRDNDS